MKAFWVILALGIPLSVSIPLIGDGHRISFPGEVMAIIALFLTAAAWLLHQQKQPDIFTHPLTIVILLWLGFGWFTALLTTTMPIVSVKAMTIQTLYVCTFYLAASWAGRLLPGLAKSMLLAAVVSVMLISFYVFYRFVLFQFNIGMSPFFPKPLINDHTLFGTLAAMLLPFTFALALGSGKSSGSSSYLRWFGLAAGTVLLAGLIISFSRGAWLGLAGGIAATTLLWAGFRFKHFAGLLMVLMGLLYWQSENIEMLFMQTSQVAEITRESDRTGFTESDEDIVYSSVSNMERLNRWRAAIAMFREKPITGFGPGTYQFQYFRFQQPEHMTTISVILPGPHDTGRGGTVHSEYLMALSETGLPGFLLFCTIWILIFYYAIQRAVYATPENRLTSLAIFCSLNTFAIHAMLNNYLGVVEGGFMVWFLVSMLLNKDD